MPEYKKNITDELSIIDYICDNCNEAYVTFLDSWNKARHKCTKCGAHVNLPVRVPHLKIENDSYKFIVFPDIIHKRLRR